MHAQSPSPAWQHYWHENRLAACAPENPKSAAAIEDHWRTFFSRLPEKSRLLDIATGNGVLLLWAAQAMRAAPGEVQLTGVDLADIDPPRFLPEHQSELAQVKFIGGTAAEDLPFDDDSFDVVVSQYGLEYADLDSALNEALRVLAPGGQLYWLAHSDDSAVVRQGSEQLSGLDLLLADDGPFAAMLAYLDAHRHQRGIQAETQALTEALRRAEAHCADHPPATLVRQLCAGILDTANSMAKFRYSDIDDWLLENRKRLFAQRQRIVDLQAACLTPARLSAVSKGLHAGLCAEVHITSLCVGKAQDPVGRLIHAVKQSAST